MGASQSLDGERGENGKFLGFRDRTPQVKAGIDQM
jgi:hypothetical protein